MRKRRSDVLIFQSCDVTGSCWSHWLRILHMKSHCRTLSWMRQILSASYIFVAVRQVSKFPDRLVTWGRSRGSQWSKEPVIINEVTPWSFKVVSESIILPSVSRMESIPKEPPRKCSIWGPASPVEVLSAPVVEVESHIWRYSCNYGCVYHASLFINRSFTKIRWKAWRNWKWSLVIAT
jgi:hypothetical protein